jgi:hypothetical protein
VIIISSASEECIHFMEGMELITNGEIKYIEIKLYIEWIAKNRNLILEWATGEAIKVS